jgi:hypothetical protein
VEAIEEEEVTIFNDDVKNQAACRPSGRYGESWDLFQPLFAENYLACKSSFQKRPFRFEMRKIMSLDKLFKGEFNPCLNQIRNRSAGHESRAKHVNLGGLKEGLLPKQQRRTQLHIIGVQQHCSTAVQQYIQCKRTMGNKIRKRQ